MENDSKAILIILFLLFFFSLIILFDVVKIMDNVNNLNKDIQMPDYIYFNCMSENVTVNTTAGRSVESINQQINILDLCRENELLRESVHNLREQVK